MRLILNRAHLFALTLSAGALIGACDLDKPIGELGPYEPCGGKSCGDACTVCDPEDPDCVETAVIKACDAEGACVPEVPGLCEEAPYDPCADKTCGDSCNQCDPNDLDCVETAVLKACNDKGACVPALPDLCGDEPGYDPCAGKSECDVCSLCDPNDPDCQETMVLKVCDASLQCVIATPEICEDEPAPYEPCEAKACGDTCTICDPDDPDCVEDAIYKACDSNGKCVPEVPQCEAPVYDPCGGKSACDHCSFCDPKDPDCIEDAALKVCDENLKCVYSAPGVCDGAYVPCEGKFCGDPCTICDPDDLDCAEDQVFKTCDDKGQCVPNVDNQCL